MPIAKADFWTRVSTGHLRSPGLWELLIKRQTARLHHGDLARTHLFPNSGGCHSLHQNSNNRKVGLGTMEMTTFSAPVFQHGQPATDCLRPSVGIAELTQSTAQVLRGKGSGRPICV